MKKFLTLALALFSATSLTTASFAGKGDYVTQAQQAPAQQPETDTAQEASDPSENDDNTDNTTAPTTYTGSQVGQYVAGAAGATAVLTGLGLIGYNKIFSAGKRKIIAANKLNDIAKYITESGLNMQDATTKEIVGHMQNAAKATNEQEALEHLSKADKVANSNSADHNTLRQALRETLAKKPVTVGKFERIMPSRNAVVNESRARGERF